MVPSGWGGVDRLVDEVPDEAALVLRIAFERGVFVHVAARIAHGVHVLAGDVRLLRIILQVFLDGVGVRIHAGLDVGHVVVVAVVGHALIVHGTVRVDVVHALVHGAEHGRPCRIRCRETRSGRSDGCSRGAPCC